MIVVIVYEELHPRTGRMSQVVSHGVDYSTGRSVVLPTISPTSLGATFNATIGEWVLDDND